VNIELAILQLEEYQSLLERGEQIYQSSPQYRWVNDPNYKDVESDLISRRILIEQIMHELGGDLLARFKTRSLTSWPHRNEVVPVGETLGLLKNRDVSNAIFGPVGPKLAANQFHPWIWNAAVSLWSDGHFSHAVSAASTALFDEHLPAKLGVVKTGGISDRITKAFSSDAPLSGEPRLRFKDLTKGSNDWTSAHEGAKFFGRGCAMGIRNVTSHGAKPNEQQALEALAALSLLARWIDEAEVETF